MQNALLSQTKPTIQNKTIQHVLRGKKTKTYPCLHQNDVLGVMNAEP